MNLKPFKITACPFPMSDATAEYTEYAKDEDAALDQFTKRYPLFRVKEVRES